MAKTSFVPNPAKIKVIGLGGGGCNAVTRMVREEIQGVEFIAMNTDAQALAITEAPIRIQLGEKLTRGLGVGGDHLKGQKAAEENRDELRDPRRFRHGFHHGRHGRSTAPVLSWLPKLPRAGLSIAVVTKPFGFEGVHRSKWQKTASPSCRRSIPIIIPSINCSTLRPELACLQDI